MAAREVPRGDEGETIANNREDGEGGDSPVLKETEEWMQSLRTGDTLGDSFINKILELQVVYITLFEAPHNLGSLSKEEMGKCFLERLKIRWNFAPSARPPTPSQE